MRRWELEESATAEEMFHGLVSGMPRDGWETDSSELEHSPKKSLDRKQGMSLGSSLVEWKGG